MYEQARKYFTGNIMATLGWLSLAMLGLIFGLCLMIVPAAIGEFSGGMFFVGLIGLAVGIFALVKLKQLNKSTAEADIAYDNLVASMMKFSKDDALAKLGLDESEVTEAAPVCISGYSYEGTGLVKKGADGKWRSNKYETWYLFFSSNEVHCCKKTIKTTENWKTESTDVYFYKDIVSVSTSSETISVLFDPFGKNASNAALTKQNTMQIDYDCFVLTTAGGTAFKVSLKDVDDAQRSVNAMRSLLRAKKQEG